jgi:hypothetical protein
MDLLITLIGNAAVDPLFRKKFLDNPIATVENYHFRLTKGEYEMLQTVFVGLDPTKKAAMENGFQVLEDVLYLNLKCGKPCNWSIFLPPQPTTIDIAA